MKTFKFFFATLGFICAATAVSLLSRPANACDAVQIESTDLVHAVRYFGNGFFVSPNEIITNDHVLAPRSKVFKLRLNKQTFQASLEQRSYNLDLALLKINDPTIRDADLAKSCPVISLMGVSRLDRVWIDGTHMYDSHRTKLSGLITNLASGQMMVPGITNALEIAAPGVTRSLSGSPVTTTEGVIGILTEKMPDSAAVFAIPSSIILKFIANAHSGHERTLPYTYDHSKHVVLFSGLKIADRYYSTEQVAGGDPHGGLSLVASGDPHGGLRPEKSKIPYVVAGNDRIGSGVSAVVVNTKKLLASQSRIAETLGKNLDLAGMKIVIQSIDGISTPNYMTLMRVLGECHECEIDRFLIYSNKPELVSNSLIRAAAYAERLTNDIELRTPTIRQRVLVANVERYASDILKLRYDLRMLHSYNMDLVRQMFATWAIVEQEFDQMPIGTTQELSDISQVRGFNAKLKVRLVSQGLLPMSALTN